MTTVMHEEAARRYHELISKAPNVRTQEHWLDQYADGLLRATEWDADQWGFDPDRWMAAERNELAGRGGCFYPREIV